MKVINVLIVLSAVFFVSSSYAGGGHEMFNEASRSADNKCSELLEDSEDEVFSEEKADSSGHEVFKEAIEQ